MFGVGVGIVSGTFVAVLAGVFVCVCCMGLGVGSETLAVVVVVTAVGPKNSAGLMFLFARIRT